RAGPHRRSPRGRGRRLGWPPLRGGRAAPPAARAASRLGPWRRRGPGAGGRDSPLAARARGWTRPRARGVALGPDRPPLRRGSPMRFRLLLALLVVGGCGDVESPKLAEGLNPVIAGGVPGALVLVRDGDRTETATVGVADVDAKSRLRLGDRF